MIVCHGGGAGVTVLHYYLLIATTMGKYVTKYLAGVPILQLMTEINDSILTEIDH